MKLNLGCGNLQLPGFVGVDAHAGPTVDVVCDLTKHPWPFADGSVDAVVAWYVLEHFLGLDLDRAMRELHRILKPGGTLEIRVPFGLRGLFDPFHFHVFNERTFSQWAVDQPTACLQNSNLFRRQRPPQVLTTNGFPLWHMMKYTPFLEGVLYWRDARSAATRLPGTGVPELREWLVRL